MHHSLSFLSLPEWQSFAGSHPESSAFHHQHWIELIAEHYGWNIHIPAIERDGAIAAAVPFVETRGLLGGKKLISLPFTDCVPALTRGNGALGELLAATNGHPSFKGHASVVLRSNKPLEGHDRQSNWYRHVLDVGAPMTDLEANFSSTIRRNLRRADAHNLSFHRRTDAEATDAFYRLHVMTRQKLGVPVQPRAFFQRLHTKIMTNGLGYVGVVEWNNRPIAAAVFLTFNTTTIYKYGASNPQLLRMRPNEFLFYNAIRHAAESGFLYFDFGITAKSNTGLRGFKQKWGPREEQVHHVYVTGTPPVETSSSRVFALSRWAIRHTPAVVCRGLGEMFYRFSQ